MKVYLLYQIYKTIYIKNVIGIFSTFEKAQEAREYISRGRTRIEQTTHIETRFLNHICEHGMEGGVDINTGILSAPKKVQDERMRERFEQPQRLTPSRINPGKRIA